MMRRESDPPSKPLLLIAGPSGDLVRTLEEDLRIRFSPDSFEVRLVSSPMEAFGLITEIRKSGGRLALLVAEQDLGADRDLGVTGVSLISAARDAHPEAKTLLLIEHRDMEVAKDALNEGSLDDFLVKPLRDHSEQFLPIVDDLLGDRRRLAEDVRAGLRLIGDPSTAETIELREFLHRNDIEHRVLNPARIPEAKAILEQKGGSALPAVAFEGGSILERPSPLELARQLGIQTRPLEASYDLAIVGGGPAGLAAAVYGASEGLQTVLLERFAPGGQAGQSSRIENYLGFPSGLSGSQLAQRALRQARRFEAEIVRPCEVMGLELEDDRRTLRLVHGAELACRTLLIACGVEYRRLEVEGIEEFTGRGVHYGAGATDARTLSGRRVAVVGGANSAGQAALHFAEQASGVTLLVRAASLTQGMSHYLCERITAHHRIAVRTRTEITAAVGQDHLNAVEVTTDMGRDQIDADELFIFIGAVPRTDWLPEPVHRDERGFILSGRDVIDGPGPTADWPLDRDPYPLETSVPGVFVAGDVRRGSIKRVASAVGEGSMAVQLVHQYLARS